MCVISNKASVGQKNVVMFKQRMLQRSALVLLTFRKRAKENDRLSLSVSSVSEQIHHFCVFVFRSISCTRYSSKQILKKIKKKR